jgi:hypothetical protein
MRADVNFRTAKKYMETTKMPSDLQKPRNYRTRQDPFRKIWPEVEDWLQVAPELDAKTLFDFFMEQNPGEFLEGQLRTFQRRVSDYRFLKGPGKEVFFVQEHRPGEAFQLDFCCANELGITICGTPFPHLLCHVVLPYSNWEFASDCQSESMLAIRRGLQGAVRKLGHVADWTQTDNSTAATHRPGQDEEIPALEDGRKPRRPFNPEYEELVRHLGMKPRTIAIAKSEQNGDVEALNGVLKRRLKQHLLLRGSRDFLKLEEYRRWRDRVLDKANGYRSEKVRKEIKVMRPLRVHLLPEYKEVTARVLSGSTISVMRNIYSVPSRLIHSNVTVRIYEEHMAVYYKGHHQLTTGRLLGRSNVSINYRHIIDSFVRKPGAFANYRYRDQMYPTMAFKRAYDRLCDRMITRKADQEYLRILKLAADTMESEVDVALQLLMETGEKFDHEDVRCLVQKDQQVVPDMPAFSVSLSDYDGLLSSNLKEAIL